jgi:ornithine cyclodeaminase/alanine dehydrogenase-like protein (mu-crystallin family)
MLHITEQQAAAALPMARALELAEESFRRLDDGRAVNHPRRRIQLENGATLHAMDAGDNVSGLLGAKLYATRPGVGAHFLVALFDAETAKLLATIEADALGRIRTGAASGVATKFLARKEARVLGVIGSGWQAETQLEACAAVRAFELVKVFSRKQEKRKAFARKMGETLGLRVEAVESAEDAVRGSDVVVTITSAKAPVVLGSWLEEGAHLNAAGSNHALRREIDGEAVERAGLIAADSVEQAKIEAGDLIQAAEEGRLDWTRVVELSGVVSGRLEGRRDEKQITLFESQGLAIEDLLVAGEIYRRVKR